MCSREAPECAYAGPEHVEFEDGVRTAAEVAQRSNLSSSQRQHVLNIVELPLCHEKYKVHTAVAGAEVAQRVSIVLCKRR